MDTLLTEVFRLKCRGKLLIFTKFLVELLFKK